MPAKRTPTPSPDLSERTGQIRHYNGDPAVLVMLADTFRALRRANVSLEPYVANSVLRLGSDISPLVALFARPVPDDRGAVLNFIMANSPSEGIH